MAQGGPWFDPQDIHVCLDLSIMSVAAGVAQLVSTWPSELKGPWFYPQDLHVCLDLSIMSVAAGVAQLVSTWPSELEVHGSIFRISTSV